MVYEQGARAKMRLFDASVGLKILSNLPPYLVRGEEYFASAPLS